MTFWSSDLCPRPPAETVARVTLRLAAPQCATDPDWEAERPASAVYRRVVRALHDHCTGPAGPLSAPGFIVCFHIVRHVLETDTGDEDMMIKGLKVRRRMYWLQYRGLLPKEQCFI